MNKINEKLIESFAILIRADEIDYSDIPYRKIILDNGKNTTLKEQVEIRVAKQTINIIESRL